MYTVKILIRMSTCQIASDKINRSINIAEDILLKRKTYGEMILYNLLIIVFIIAGYR